MTLTIEPARFKDSGIRVSGKNRSVFSTAYNRGADDTAKKNNSKVVKGMGLLMQDAFNAGVREGQRSVQQATTVRLVQPPQPVQQQEVASSSLSVAESQQDSSTDVVQGTAKFQYRGF